MREFEIRLCSVKDVQEFVALATAQSFPIFLKDGRHKVNGKAFMELFCLNFHRPVTVSLDCTEEELDAFHRSVRHFVVD